jgi:glycosyltransferase involved in cell wall biosynthesis
MTPSAEFDVLICTHRLNAELRAALNSCFEQTLEPRCVVLVVNGLSIGETEQGVLNDLKGEWPALRVLTTPVRGLVFSLNLGLHACQSPIVARMDADDLALPHRFERQMAWMMAHPETTILGTSYQLIDEHDRVMKVVGLPTEDRQIRRAMRWGNPVCHPSVMYRRQPILDLGGYLGALHAEDYDLWLRVSRHADLQFANLSEVCLSYRARSTSEARRSREAYASVLVSQVRQLVTGGGAIWAVAALWSLAKLAFRSARPKSCQDNLGRLEDDQQVHGQ